MIIYDDEGFFGARFYLEWAIINMAWACNLIINYFLLVIWLMTTMLFQDQKRPHFCMQSHQPEWFIPLQSPAPQVYFRKTNYRGSNWILWFAGNLTECGCDNRGQGRSTPEGWKWGGCRYVYNFNVQYKETWLVICKKC